MNIALRPQEAGDDAFLRRLIGQAVSEELGADAWPAPMRDHLIGIQCTVRLQAPRTHFPQGQSRIAVAGGVEAGWLYTANLSEELRLVEIMLAREWRGRGVGSALVRQLIAEAGTKPVRLYVNATNTTAIRFYQKLGFRRRGGDEVQHLMEYQAAPSC